MSPAPRRRSVLLATAAATVTATAPAVASARTGPPARW